MGCAEPESESVRIGSRDSERVRVLAPLSAVDGKGTVTIIIRDLGTTGAQIETRPPRFQSGDVVFLHLPLLRAEKVAQVMWSKGAMAAIAFSQPLDNPTFRILAKAMQPPPDSLGYHDGARSSRWYRMQRA